VQPVAGGRLDFGGPFRTGSADHIEFCGRPFFLSSGACAVGGRVKGGHDFVLVLNARHTAWNTSLIRAHFIGLISRIGPIRVTPRNFEHEHEDD
jgi:hypothetical protein